MNSLQSNKFFLILCTLCDIFIVDINNFLDLIILEKNRF